MRRERFHRLSFQLMTLLIAMVKLYVISIIQGSETFYNPAFGQTKLFLKLTFLFGIFIIGNVVDNVSQPRYVVIVLQVFLSISWILTGIFVHTSLSLSDEEIIKKYEAKQAFVTNLQLSQLTASGVVLINILQISNWFTQKNINKVLALYLMMQFAGYMTPMEWIKSMYESVEPIVYWYCGIGMLLISILDHFVFAFHPLEKNIFLYQDKFKETTKNTSEATMASISSSTDKITKNESGFKTLLYNNIRNTPQIGGNE